MFSFDASIFDIIHTDDGEVKEGKQNKNIQRKKQTNKQTNKMTGGNRQKSIVTIHFEILQHIRLKNNSLKAAMCICFDVKSRVKKSKFRIR